MTSGNPIDIDGEWKAGYEKVVGAFEENFEYRRELGAAFCMYHHGKKVVDIWAGQLSDKDKGPWQNDTVVPFFSTSKALAAVALALCNSRGYFEYQDKVAQHWPEFAQKGKENITVEQLLQHRAGLAALSGKLDIATIKSPTHLDALLAAQKPDWVPDSGQGYHVWTIGWYISALLCRIDPQRRRLSQFLRDEILPHIEGEFQVGIPEDYDLKGMAEIIPFSKLEGMKQMPWKFIWKFFQPWSLTFRAMLKPSFVADHSNFNKREILELDMASGTGLGNARGLATLFNAINDSKHPLFLKPETRSYLESYPGTPPSGFSDKVFLEDAFRFHAGFMKPSPKHNFSADKRAYGGFGAGGSFVFHDPARSMSASYVMNRMDAAMMNMPCELALRDAIDRVSTELASDNTAL